MSPTPTRPAPSPREAVARIVYDRALPRNGTPFDCAVPSWVRDDAYKTADAAITAHTAALLAAASEPMPEERECDPTCAQVEFNYSPSYVCTCGAHDEYVSAMYAYAVAQVAANAALRERLAGLEADAKRVDWLEQENWDLVTLTSRVSFGTRGWFYLEPNGCTISLAHPSLRAAIDAALTLATRGPDA